MLALAEADTAGDGAAGGGGGGGCWAEATAASVSEQTQRTNVFIFILWWSDAVRRPFGFKKSPSRTGSFVSEQVLAQGFGELLFFGRAAKGRSRAISAGNHLCHCVEIASADFVLVFGRGITVGRGSEFSFL